MKALLVVILILGCASWQEAWAAESETQTVSNTNAPVRLPPVEVTGQALRENAPVGPYNQPEWTTERRFPTTRVYLQQPPWGFGLEQWVKAQYPRGEAPNYLFQEEAEMGLPGRFQFDFYENWIRDTDTKVKEQGVATELRWALADWGKIPMNPTLYAEWEFNNHSLQADEYELKLLLGDNLGARWHWGINFINEQEVGQGRTSEYSASQGISYTLLDQKLSLGMELKEESETEKGARGPAPYEVDIGPSLQWLPTRNTHLDLVPLFGVTGDSPHIEAYFVFGYDFGPGNNRVPMAPVSTRSQ